MKSTKYCLPMLLLCVLLANMVKQTNSGDISKDALMEILTYVGAVAGALSIGPYGPVVIASLGLIQLSAKIFTVDEKDPLTKADFFDSQSKIADAIKTVDTHVQESQRVLIHEIGSYLILEDMRNDVDFLSAAFDDSMQVILNPKVTVTLRDSRMKAMLDYYGDFRKILRSFVSKYIKPKDTLPAQGQVKLFFDFILNKESIEVDGGDYCHSESTHTKLFKSYINILKTLTNAYVMAISAHAMQYQTELKNYTEKAVETHQTIGLKLLNQYKADMKIFMEKAKWAMDKSSREIQNCGTFELKQGETFESISFAYMLPKFVDWNYDRSRSYSVNRLPEYKCFKREEDVKYDDYGLGDICTDGDLDTPTAIKSTNSNWPFLYLDFGEKEPKYFGHRKTGPGLLTREYFFTRRCNPIFCPAFKKKSIFISTQIIRAKYGNVITGLRFRKRRKVIYIDIQEGKFLDDLSVDPETVTWTETPKSKNKISLSSNIRKLELGAVEVKRNEYLTSIQLKWKDKAEGIIGLNVGGGNRASNWTTSDLTGSSYLDKSNELVLSECDNPEQFGSGVKNMISKAPVPSKPYHVSFQPTDLKKDFGITTVPFIDLREVVSNPSAPLGGFGLYHHSVKGSGGFISLKLISRSFSSYIDYKFIEAIDTTKAKVK